MKLSPTYTPQTFQSFCWKLKLKYWIWTLFYHSQFSLDYAVDVLIEPLLLFVDYYTKFLGRFFVTGVIVMISIVTFVVHTVGFAFWWNRSPACTIILCIIGYWLLMNITFNLYRAITLNPGEPTDPVKLRKSDTGVFCKACISPKPARTHHCSVCRRCYLKMDHHCPWINNCVGHYNHRYFYLSAAYIVLGSIFVMTFGAEIAFRCFLGSEDILPFEIPEEFRSKKSENRAGMSSGISSVDATRLIFLSLLGVPLSLSDWESSLATAETIYGIRLSRFMIKVLIVIAALICIGASVLLGGLCYWHGHLISNGETSIEHLVNEKKRKRLGERFVNIYDLGLRQNWILFLGLDQPGRSFWRHVLLPSMHLPTGDGYDWTRAAVQYKEEEDRLSCPAEPLKPPEIME